MGCAPPRTIISTAIPRSSTSRSRRCSRAWSRRLRASLRRSISPAAQKRSQLVLQRWPTPARSAAARARSAALARPCRASRQLPTGTYFADWVAPSAQQAFDADFGEVKVRDDARPRPAAAGGARGRPGGDRRRAGRAGRDAARRPRRRDGRRQELRATRPSTASPRRGASPARRSNCSSISRRFAPAGRPTA